MVSSGRHSVLHGARSVRPRQNSEDLVQFYVGTASTVEQNRLYVLEFASSVQGPHVKEIAAYSHPDEIRALCPLEGDQGFERVATVGRDAMRIMTVKEGEIRTDAAFTLSGKARAVDSRFHNRIVAASTTHAVVVDEKAGALSAVHELPGRDITAVRCDPRESEARIAVADMDGVQLSDLRSGLKKSLVLNVERPLDVDFNPNRSNLVATGSEDGQVNVWDLRHVAAPFIRYYGHSHWVRSVEFNPLHDNLLLSGGTDGVVYLWRDEEHLGGSDKPLSVFESISAFPEHDDSICGVSWSCADEFVFASVSYDGRFATNLVPSDLKNEILLS